MIGVNFPSLSNGVVNLEQAQDSLSLRSFSQLQQQTPSTASRPETVNHVRSGNTSALSIDTNPGASSSVSTFNGNPIIELPNRTISSVPCIPNRPASTPAHCTDSSSIDIPPRRILPFARPHTSVPKLRNEPGQNITQGAASHVKFSGGAEISPLAAKSLTTTAPAASSGLQSKECVTKRRSSTPSNAPQTVKRLKMVSQGTQTQTISGRDHTAGIVKAPFNDVTENSNGVYPELNPLLATCWRELFAFIKKDEAPLVTKELWEIPGYADGDEDARDTMLNDFICANLANEDFRKLCEDIEHAWRRIGLGM